MTLENALNRAWLGRGLGMRLLWPLSLLMGLIVGGRRIAYRIGLLSTTRLPVPVIVVGNRIVGGAGKTPTTMAVIEHLQARGWRPGVLSRGYKAAQTDNGPVLLDHTTHEQLTAQSTGDEPMLIWRRTQAPVMVGRDRGASGLALLQQHPGIDVLICDDGLQHLALARDVEVIVFDERGAGNGWLLPAGPLREPIAVRAPAGLRGAPLVVYNAQQASTHLSGHLGHKHLLPPVPLSDWWSGRAPSQTLTPGQAVWAAAGIAQPTRFFDALKAQGLLVTEVALPDHDALDKLPWPEHTSHVVLTEKDAVKLHPDRMARERPHTQVWVAALDFTIENGFWARLDSALPAHPSSPACASGQPN